jgi:hypothetical protein
MALNFPNSPTNGQSYIDGSSGNRWVWDAANTAWISTSTFTQTVTVSSTQPGSPVVGQLWWNQDYGRLLVYYSDGSSSQWVDASPSDATGAVAYNQANAAYAAANNVNLSAPYNTANAAYNTANAAYGKANTALQNGSVTLAGSLTTTGSITSSSRGITQSSMPSGSVLQVVSTTKTDTFTTSVNMSASGGSWTSTGTQVTGLTATITPTSSSSKILVMVTLNGTGTAGAAQIYCLLYRDSTIIGSPAPSSAKPGVMARNYATDNNVVNGTCGFTYLDSPGSTSSITYSIKVGGENSSAVYVNQPANNNDSTNGARMSSTITVMEIAQ